MVGRPFNIQAPEEIAKEYGGNKQKIAQGMQLGFIDPTAGVLAGMFIDRMRGAQMQEMQQSPTVAQQVMGGAPAAPVGPPAAGGLGALPPPAPSMTPPMGPPGAPPMPPGMADGGYLPPYASGGLSDLPVPDAMFDEPGNGGYGDGYSGGGIVAFATAGPVVDPEVQSFLRDRQAMYDAISAQQPGISQAPEIAAYRKYLEGVPAEMEAQRKQDKWMALAQLGANLAASQSPYFLQAVGEATSKALPAIAESAKERRATQREAIRDNVELALKDSDLKGKNLDRAATLATSIAEAKLRRENMRLEAEYRRANLGLEGLKTRAYIDALGKKTMDPEAFIMQKYLYGTPAEQNAVSNFLKDRYGQSRKSDGTGRKETEDRLRGGAPAVLDFDELGSQQ